MLLVHSSAHYFEIKEEVTNTASLTLVSQKMAQASLKISFIYFLKFHWHDCLQQLF